MARKTAPKERKNRHFKDKQQTKLTANIVNNIESIMMEKASEHKKRMSIVKKPKVAIRSATAPLPKAL
jgi:hypothetical protein